MSRLKIFFLVLLSSFLSMTCSNTTSVDDMGACRGVDCSGHGTCRIIGGEPQCDCFKGYIVDTRTGLNCVPAGGDTDTDTDT
ncbi:MAG: hypothetical protein GXP49_11325, partial [Deltaproteobacteria bacterium]|nr:hypothetical protein [Deltaproteobacteria bacterium]